MCTAAGACYLREHPTQRRALQTRSASKTQADQRSCGGGSGDDDKSVVTRVEEAPTDAAHHMTVINVDAADVGRGLVEFLFSSVVLHTTVTPPHHEPALLPWWQARAGRHLLHVGIPLDL